MIYLGQCNYNIGRVIDLISYNQAISIFFFPNKWLEGMEDEMRSMTHNSV